MELSMAWHAFFFFSAKHQANLTQRPYNSNQIPNTMNGFYAKEKNPNILEDK